MQVKPKVSRIAVLIFVADMLLSARSGPAQVTSLSPDTGNATSPAITSSGYSDDQAAPADSDSSTDVEADAGSAPDMVDLLSLPVRLPAAQLLLGGLSPIPLGPTGAPGSSSSLPFIAIVGFGVLAGGIASAMRTRSPAR